MMFFNHNLAAVALLAPLALAQQNVLSDAVKYVKETAQSVFSPSSKPHVFLASIAAFAHFEKIVPIANGLLEAGHPVTWFCGEDFKGVIEATGAKFMPWERSANVSISNVIGKMNQIPPGPEQEIFGFMEVFIKTIPGWHETTQKAFRAFHSDLKTAEQPIILIHESPWAGAAPIRLGAPGINPDEIIALGITPFSSASIDTFPFISGLHPDTSPHAHKIHAEAQAQAYDMNAPMDTAFQGNVASTGATPPDDLRWFDFVGPNSYGLVDSFLQLQVPEFEYPRSDLRPHVHFIGPTGQVGMGHDKPKPAWWDEVTVNKGSKRIIVVTSGSAADAGPENLLLPTFEACKDMQDTLVVAVLPLLDDGTSPEEYLARDFNATLPSNVRLAHFVPFDDLFPHVDLLIAGGGYGTVCQALWHGVPMVLSGRAQEKPHNGALAEWAGVAVDLKSRQPGVERIGEAVGRVLGDGEDGKGIRERAEWFKSRTREFDAVESVRGAVMEAAEKFERRKREASVEGKTKSEL